MWFLFIRMKELLTSWLFAINNLGFNKGLIFIAMLIGCLMTIPLMIVSQEIMDLKSESEPSDSAQMKNFVSAELGGNGLIYTLNYSRIIFPGKNKRLIVRFGFEYVPSGKFTHFFLFPGELYLQTGRMKHHFEIGAGITYEFREKKYSEDHVYNYIFLRIGYGHQKPGRKFYYRIGFTPFTGILTSSLDRLIMPFGGVSVGYAF